MKEKESLVECIRLVVEAKMREADMSDGTKVTWGSDAHINELQTRIADLVRWRDRQRKGTEARANYARLISRLKSELRSAMGHRTRLDDVQ
jgi:hypothetical protein